MISKLTPLLLLSSASGALITVGTTAYSAGSHASLSCRACLTAGYRYCLPNGKFSREATITDTNKCVAPTTLCTDGEALQVGDGEYAELAILACNELESCGARWTEVTSEVDITPSADIPAGHTCSLGFKYTGSMPIVKIEGGASFATSGVAAYLFDYTLDDRLSVHPNDSFMPAFTNTLHDVTANCAENGKCSGPFTSEYQYVYRLNDQHEIVSTRDILATYNEFLDRKLDYLIEAESAFHESNFFAQALGLYWRQLVPTYPDGMPYTGETWAGYKSLGGWGDLSMRTLDLNTNTQHFYNFGTDLSANSQADGLVVDLNTDSSKTRVMIVQFYNGGASTITAAQASVKAIPNISASYMMFRLQAPEITGGAFKAVGALTAAAIVAMTI